MPLFRLKTILYILIFQLVFSQVIRGLFILLSGEYFYLKYTFLSIIHGFSFDVGVGLLTTAIIIILSTILSCFTYIISKKNLSPFFLIFFHFLFTFVQVLISTGDILLYKYWDSIFNIRAIPYLINSHEMMRNVSSINIVFVVVYISFFIILIYIFHRYILRVSTKPYTSFKLFLKLLLTLIGLSIFSIFFLRGGFREIPKNQSDGYVCDKKMYNLATINSTWNFFNVLFEHKLFLTHNPYRKLDENKVEVLWNEMFGSSKNNPIDIFQPSSHPNIVLIMMEGVSAEVLKIHNQEKNYMPFLESLIDSSYYFTNAYSVGFRTEQGIAALLSGSLSTPYNNLTDNVNTTEKLPSIVQSLRSRKYHSSFYFGGNIEFANMKAYLKDQKFDSIIDIVNFPKDKQTQSLGVADEYLFQELTKYYLSQKNPFFIHVLNLSTHEPFDIKEHTKIIDEKTLYLNSVQYLDKQLRYFFEHIQSSNEFKNTIFIITSDHSHRMPNDLDIAEKQRYHIPLIIHSPLLHAKYKGKKDTVLFAQQNFPATLSHLLNWKEKNYLMTSHSHFSNSNKIVMSSFVNGYLFQTDSTAISYDYVWRPYDTTDMNLVKKHNYPQAILQRLTDQIRGKIPIK